MEEIVGREVFVAKIVGRMDYAAALVILEAEGVDIDPEMWAEAIELAKEALRDLLRLGVNGPFPVP